ncbi:MAG TPA: STAS domain-containing protein [Polyangium sp.]|nr:STAS domain-containing protein [Polyangium sp.]
MSESEQEIARLRRRVEELEARLARNDEQSHLNDEGGEGVAMAHELPQRETILQTLLDHLDIVVWAINGKGECLFHDGVGCEAVGIPRGSLYEKNFFEIFPDTHNMRRAAEGTPQHDITDLNGVIWENWLVPVRKHENDAWNVIGMSLNVTSSHLSKVELEAKMALIEKQQAAIEQLETPIIRVWDRILALPMVGVVDSRRAARVTDDLLNEVARAQARFAILDLTGVEVVDTATASHLLNIISAVRLLGAEGLITGIRPKIAQTIISLGVNLAHVRTYATLRDGLAFAMRKVANAEEVRGSFSRIAQ